MIKDIKKMLHFSSGAGEWVDNNADADDKMDLSDSQPSGAVDLQWIYVEGFRISGRAPIGTFSNYL